MVGGRLEKAPPHGGDSALIVALVKDLNFLYSGCDGGAMAELKFNCLGCGTEITLAASPGRRDECPTCGADLHVCRNCRHYDRTVYNECRETSADVVREKDRANFCDFFVLAGPGASGADMKNELFAAAEALFKKKP